MSDKRPNILLLFSDQHRGDWLGCATDLPVRTPNIDALAARGVRFTNAVCPAPFCGPARACLATGREYDRCGVPLNNADIPTDVPSFYSLLRDSGYHTVGCGKLDLNRGSNEWGLDGKTGLDSWGFSDGLHHAGRIDGLAHSLEAPSDPYMKYLYDNGLFEMFLADYKTRVLDGRHWTGTHPTKLPEEAYHDNYVGNTGIEFLKKMPIDKPWFMQVSFSGPHMPMDVTERMAREWEGVEFPPPIDNDTIPREQRNATCQRYAGMIENIDRWVGIYIDLLRERGELDNTIVIYSSDHGELLGDHGRFGKLVPYAGSIDIPLVMAGPGIQKRKTTDAVASLTDLRPTLLDYGNVSPDSGMDGTSFRGVVEGCIEYHRDYVYSGLQGWRMIYDGRYKLVTGFPKEGDTVLWNSGKDDSEVVNLANDHPEITQQLKSDLEAALPQQRIM